MTKLLIDLDEEVDEEMLHVLNILRDHYSATDSADSALTPLMRAVMEGNAEEVWRHAVRSEVNKRDETGRTALIMAAQTGNDEAVRALIEAGADTHAQDQEEKTALMYAAEEGHEGIVKRLLLLVQGGQEGAAGGRDGGDAMVDESHAINTGITQPLLATTTPRSGSRSQPGRNEGVKGHAPSRGKGEGWETRDRLGRTALMLAAGQGHPGVVALLLKHGADANALSKKRETALCRVREERIVRKLIKKEAKVWTVSEEDIRRHIRDTEAPPSGEPEEYIRAFRATCPDISLSPEEIERLEDTMRARLAGCTAVREILLRAGGYDVREVDNPEAR